MPKINILLSRISFFIVAVRTVSTTAFTAITSFKMKLFCKDFIAFRRQVKITFFKRYYFFHFVGLNTVVKVHFLQISTKILVVGNWLSTDIVSNINEYSYS